MQTTFHQFSRLLTRALMICSLLAGFGLTACDDDDDTGNTTPQSNIVQLAQGNPNLSTLVAAVQKADLVTTLSGTTELTVFAPTNDAFSQLPAPFNSAQSITAITDANQIAALRGILLYHVIAGDLDASELREQSYTTQRPATTGTTDNVIAVTKPAAGGVVINGNTRVIQADVNASNGMVHVIDRVLMPPTTTPMPSNIVQLAQATPSLATLVAAVQKADLVTTLSGTTQLTVFAPTNDAFAQLPAPFNSAQSITAITDAAQIAALRNILLYHVTAGDLKAADLRAQAYATSAAAPNNNIYLSKPAAGGVFINGSTRVTTADVDASNGVVHVIDRVLTPPSQSIGQIVRARASATTNPEFTLLLQALQRPGAASILATADNASANVTVFAPTDQAFRNLLGNAQLSSVSDADLTVILSRHVIASGRVFSSDLVPGTVATAGGNVTIAAAGSGFTVRGVSGTEANITTANLLATNGVIHVIDQVIRPN